MIWSGLAGGFPDPHWHGVSVGDWTGWIKLYLLCGTRIYEECKSINIRGCFIFVWMWPWKACHGWPKFTNTTPLETVAFYEIMSKNSEIYIDKSISWGNFWATVRKTTKTITTLPVKMPSKLTLSVMDFPSYMKGVCGSRHIANSDICRQACSKHSSAWWTSSFQIVQSLFFFFWWTF